jgi:hypothetical protein
MLGRHRVFDKQPAETCGDEWRAGAGRVAYFAVNGAQTTPSLPPVRTNPP